MTERLFGGQRRPKGITLAEWPEKPCAEAMAAAQPPTEPGKPPLQLSCILVYSHSLDPTNHTKARAIQPPGQTGCFCLDISSLGVEEMR